MDLAEFAGREQEMEAWLKSTLSADKVIIYWHRCDYMNQWHEIVQLIDSIPDDLVFFNANEDHIFMDSNADLFEAGLQTILNDPNPAAVLMTSHYPEHVRTSHVFDGYLTDDGKFTVYTQVNNDSIRVIKKPFLYWYLQQQRPENKFFRFEDWNRVVLPRNTIYSAINEQFRHYDGYWCCEIGAEVCPPVELPPHFFDGMTIRYGFKDRDPECVNINPLAENLYSIDPINGADYKFTLDDLPKAQQNYYKKLEKKQLDYSTFTHSLARNEIETVKNKIKDMYRIKYVYTLKELIKIGEKLFLIICSLFIATNFSN